ncbi:MAG: flavodoxin family protein [Candidatus Methanoperedens sp.]|jgi:multimeric flavodoxin WrbA|nr:flavodoxin family protein [Candidatus Methanoperedens sp.]PKL54226.1 MAG: iron-sulfur protein [Candidatus Methanoperedenaceae archaeon HGW-Methanoperedenaceae-1]
MKITGISGSPNIGGNNERIIDLALGIAKEKGFETDKIFISQLEVSPCTDCGACKNGRECSINDDMAKLYGILENSDAFIVSSPVFFGCVSAQLKALFDRSVLLRRNGFLLKGKIGGAVAIGGSRNGGQEFTIQAIHSWMHIHGMVVVGDSAHFGGSAVKPVDSDDDGLKTVRDTVEMVCDTLTRMGK